MKMPQILAFAALAATLCAIPLRAEEHEKKIQRTDLPPAVEKTVAIQSQGATIKGFNQVEEDGKTNYEAEMTMNGHSKDVLIGPSGGIVEIEEEVDMAALPTEVKQGLQTKAGAGKLGKVESLTKHGKLVAYEAKVTTNGQRTEIQVGPNGKPLDREE
jgi:hypothetical protein